MRPRSIALRFAVLLCSVVATVWGIAPAHAKRPKRAKQRAKQRTLTHVVKSGQTLDMIAKRYHTSAGAIRRANRLGRRNHIFPGQKLRVPEVAAHAQWRAFLEARAARKDAAKQKIIARRKAAEARRRKAEEARKRKAAEARRRAALERRKAAEALRKAAEARKLAASKKRKAAEAKRRAAAAKRKAAAEKRRAAAAKRKAAALAKKRAAEAERKRREARRWKGEPKRPPLSGSGPEPFARKPHRPGYVRLVRNMGKFRGTLVNRRGKVPAKARKRVERLLRSRRTGEAHHMHKRLLRMLTDVSDHFGGRTLIIISGFRPKTAKQFTKNSKHNHGKAIDFRVVGVPNEVVRDYCKRFLRAGVGYYPNSTFIHLDVRAKRTSWIDYSKPGQRPIYAKDIARRRRAREAAERRKRAAKRRADRNAARKPAPRKAKGRKGAKGQQSAKGQQQPTKG